MTVSDLQELLEKCDPNAEVATFAGNTYSTGEVGEIKLFSAAKVSPKGTKDFVLIGNYRQGLDEGPFFVKEEVK